MTAPSQQASGDFNDSVLTNKLLGHKSLIKFSGEGGIEKMQYYLDLFEISEYLACQLNPLH